MMARQKTKMGPKLGVAGILCDGAGRILLARRAHDPGRGRWAFPGGSVKAGESLRHAVAREFAEETGLVVKPGRLIYVAEIVSASHHFVILDFVVVEPVGREQAGSDAKALAWVDEVASSDLPLADGMREALSDPALREICGWATV